MPYAALICRYAIAIVFAVAFVSKAHRAAAFREYREAVRGYLSLTASPATAVAVAVIAAEAAVAVLVAVPGTAAAGLVLAIGLLTAFTVVLHRAIRRGVRASCRCFGGASRVPGRDTLARNAILLLVAVAGLLAHVTGAATVPAATLALCLGTAVILAIVLIFSDDLVAIAVPPG
jgi:hypothetical protein